MKHWKPNGKAIVVTAMLITVLLWAGDQCQAQTASQPAAQLPAPGDTRWPQRRESNGHSVLLYQPQVDSWENHARISFRAAIAVRPSGQKDYVYGVMHVEADTKTDVDARTVLATNTKRELRFPTVPEEEAARLIGIVDLFEALCWSVIGQQINLQFAYKTKRRLVERYGSRIEYGGKNYYLFPTPGQLAAATMEELKGMQFSQNKARYLIGLGEVFAKGDLSKEQLIAIDGLEERRKALTDLKGVGIWTANYSLMKSLRDPTCIPHGDVGLLNALAGHAIIKERSEEQKIEKLFSKFPGWESYLVFYLWRSLAGPGRAAPRSLAV